MLTQCLEEAWVLSVWALIWWTWFVCCTVWTELCTCVCNYCIRFQLSLFHLHNTLNKGHMKTTKVYSNILLCTCYTCFPCRAYRAGLAMSLVVFVRVCFAKMTWNTVNIGPIFNFGSTWYRRLWSSRTGGAVQALISCLSSGVGPNYLFRFTQEICSNGTNLLTKEWHIVKKACFCIRLPKSPACFSLMSW